MRSLATTGGTVHRFFDQAKTELNLPRETAFRAVDALCAWLDRHVGGGHDPHSFLPAAKTAQARRAADRLIDRALDAIDAPHRGDVTLAMSLRSAGLTLDQVDPFVALFLAHLQQQAMEGFARTEQRLHVWLDRGRSAGEHDVVSH